MTDTLPTAPTHPSPASMPPSCPSPGHDPRHLGAETASCLSPFSPSFDRSNEKNNNKKRETRVMVQLSVMSTLFLEGPRRHIYALPDGTTEGRGGAATGSRNEAYGNTRRFFDRNQTSLKDYSPLWSTARRPQQQITMTIVGPVGSSRCSNSPAASSCSYRAWV